MNNFFIFSRAASSSSTSIYPVRIWKVKLEARPIAGRNITSWSITASNPSLTYTLHQNSHKSCLIKFYDCSMTIPQFSMTCLTRILILLALNKLRINELYAVVRLV